MAKVVIAGDAVVITSSVKFEDLQLVKKYRKDALTLKGGESGKEPVFSIFVKDCGKGDINDNGVVFASATRDEEKLATVTMSLPEVGVDADVKKFVADSIGGALANLNALEATLPTVVEEIKTQYNNVLENITVA